MLSQTPLSRGIDAENVEIVCAVRSALHWLPLPRPFSLSLALSLSLSLLSSTRDAPNQQIAGGKANGGAATAAAAAAGAISAHIGHIHRTHTPARCGEEEEGAPFARARVLELSSPISPESRSGFFRLRARPAPLRPALIWKKLLK
jgi:hypothetical protein